jgi:hypothetical protein
MLPPILDGDLVPDESADDAQTRLARRPQDGLTVDVSVPGGTVSVPVTRSDADTLVAGQLYLALYNKSGLMPDVNDFSPRSEWSDQERREMGLPPRRKVPLLEASNAAPFVSGDRLGLAPLHEFTPSWSFVKTSGNYRARVRLDRAGFITHFVIGTRDRLLLAAALVTPLPMHAGDTLTLGVKLSDQRQLPGETTKQIGPS